MHMYMYSIERACAELKQLFDSFEHANTNIHVHIQYMVPRTYMYTCMYMYTNMCACT